MGYKQIGHSVREYWMKWMWCDAMRRIITVNCLIWLALWVVYTFTAIGDAAASWVSLPADMAVFLTRPWTLVTYMFVQVDYLHVLANMLWLLPFGRLYEMMRGGRRLVILYLYGGLLAGAVFLTCGLLPVGTHSWMMGASCSVLAVVGAVWVLQPSWQINLLMFGTVKVKWLALAAVVFLVLIATSVDEIAAHAAGLLTGIGCALARSRGIDLMRPALAVCDFCGKLAPRPKARPVSAGPATTGRTTRQRPDTSRHSAYSSDDERSLDVLLDKISRSGYDSLTPAERQRLFDLSRRQKI